MGMNNSDFLSEAVALDLGKSGVKVAETLEIQVGDEWWRLINAAAVTEGSIYNSRRFVDPIIVGDEIHIEGMLQDQGITYPLYDGSGLQKASAVGITGDDKIPIYCFLGAKRADAYGANYQLGYWPIIRVQKEDGTVLGEYNPSASYRHHVHFLFWDSVNARFIGVLHNASNSCFALGMTVDGTAITMSSTRSGTYAPSRDVKAFLEKPGYVYSLFYSGTSLYFKETAITSGMDRLTLGRATVHFDATLCTQITVAENTGGVGWLFFSRTFNSVGLMWRDSNTGLVKYALQSEAFATAYIFPDLTFGGSKTIESVGNFVIPQEGEFLVVKASTLVTGTLARPTGWSYPANFSIIGTAEVANNVGVILGKVGTTLYRLEVNLTTMAITKIWSVTLPNEAESFMNLIYAKNGYEIYACNSNGSTIFCLNTTSEALMWAFSYAAGDWTTSTLWPTTSPYSYVFFRMGPNHVIFARTRNDYPKGDYSDSYVVAFADLITCTSIADVYAVMLAAGRSTKTLNSSSYFTFYKVYNPRPSHSIENDAYYYLIENSKMSNGNQFGIAMFLKTEKTLVNNEMYQFSAQYVQGVGYSHETTEIVPFGFIEPGYTYTKWNEFEETDGVMAAYVSANNSSSTSYYRKYVNAMHLYSPTGQYSRTAIAPYIPSTSNKAKKYMSPLGEKYSRLVFDGDSTVIRVHGCSFTPALTTSAGYYTAVTLPFTYAFGILGTLSQKFYALSNIVDGDISWARLHAREGLERTMYAVRATNLSEIYTIKGLEVSGGWADAKFQGRIITGVTGVGKTIAVDLGASDTEGYDEAGGDSGSSASAYVYQYLTRTYVPYPFAREGIRAELSNISKTTKITLPETQDNLIRGMLAAGTDFRGSRCILRRVFPDHIDEPGSDIVLLDGYIQDWSYVPGKKGIAFSVSKTLIDVGAQFPKRLMNMGCSHVFKGSRCRYLGEEGRCLKTRTFCTSLGNINQFGGFPWVAARQRRVMWK